MTKSRDHRQEPDDNEEGTSERFRVDRVFVPPRSAATGRPTRRPTGPPPAAGSAAAPAVSRTNTDIELGLRRQLSRLQHQLAEAQRELANKDEELATATEKRLHIQNAYDALIEQQRHAQQELHDVADYRARMEGVEERLHETTVRADELAHQLDRERTERAALTAQLAEANAAFERARSMWRDESALLAEQHAAQLAQIEQSKRTAIEAAEAAMNSTLERQREAHEAELEALRAAHERSLAALRGELEPQVVATRDLNEEITRLSSAMAAQAAEFQNLLAERVELHKWELAQQIETHSGDLAALKAQHATELARMIDEVAAANEAGKQIDRNARLREQLWQQTVANLRDSQKKLQQEVADAKERAAQADTNRSSIEQRLASTQYAFDKLATEVRGLRDRLEEAERDARRNGLDRQRFAAYLEEGLAMLGAAPARAETAADPHVIELDPNELEPDGDENAEAVAQPHAAATPADISSRPTRNFEITDLVPEGNGEPAPDPEPEPEALPEPTRPGSIR